MIFVVIINIIGIAIDLAVAQCLIKGVGQCLILAGGNLIEHSGEVNGEAVAEDTLAENSDHLDVHPGHKGLSVVRLAPSGQTTAHTIDLNLKLFQSHGSPAGLRRIIVKFSDDVAFLTADLGKFFQKVRLCAGGELLALEVTCLVLTLQDCDGVESTVGILFYKLQRSRNDRRSALAVSVNLRSELTLLAEACGVRAPVRTSISGNVLAEVLDVGLKLRLDGLGDGNHDRLEVFSVVNLHLAHVLGSEDVIEVGHHEVAALLPLGVLEGGLLVGVGLAELLELFVDGLDATSDEHNELLQGAAVGVFGIVPGELLDVAGSRDAADG
mmetsp:Transcript_10654/g.29984  ORF Transcript_10654/g.29984 Transcript_10654/m.29984 type:complete len:326 (+) Transcript_10654:259-1236(+)